jgi:MoaA/NifB/PqqE/SkfB family radical SAM enzyme
VKISPAAASSPFTTDKILGHADRIQEWLATGRSRPITVVFDLTNRCNQNCPRCFGFHPRRSAARAGLADARRIIRQIREMGARGLTFTGGGDPLTSPIACRALRFARAQGLDLGFITNAAGLTAESGRTILESCQWVRISLDAATPRVYKLTHGMDASAFRRVLDKVRLLVRLKREEGRDCTVGLGFLTSAASRRDILPFAALGRDLGVDYVQYRPLLRRFGEAELDYSDPGILDDMRRARELSADGFQVLDSTHKYRLIQGGNWRRAYGKCYGQHFAAVVAADGRMYVCCHMRGVDKYCLGDLSRQSLRGI